MMNLDINMGSIWTMLVGTAIAIVYMFNTFVTNATFTEFQTDIHYIQFYELLAQSEHAQEDGHPALAAELRRQMERLRAKICEEDPEWERCD